MGNPDARHLYTTAWFRLVLLSLRSHFLVTSTLGFGTRLNYHLIGSYVVIWHYDWRTCSSITPIPDRLEDHGCNRGGAGLLTVRRMRWSGPAGNPCVRNWERQVGTRLSQFQSKALKNAERKFRTSLLSYLSSGCNTF